MCWICLTNALKFTWNLSHINYACQEFTLWHSSFFESWICFLKHFLSSICIQIHIGSFTKDLHWVCNLLKGFFCKTFFKERIYFISFLSYFEFVSGQTTVWVYTYILYILDCVWEESKFWQDTLYKNWIRFSLNKANFILLPSYCLLWVPSFLLECRTLYIIMYGNVCF